jgi:hypothetical protein
MTGIMEWWNHGGDVPASAFHYSVVPTFQSSDFELIIFAAGKYT